MRLKPWEDREWRPYVDGAAIWTDTEDGRRAVADVYGHGQDELAAHIVALLESRRSIPASAVCFFRDGDKMCAVFGDFVNLQESPAGFGDNFEEALADLERKRKKETVDA